MNKARMDGLYLLLAGMAIFLAICGASERLGIAWMIDFKSVYYGTRCLMQHHDPYQLSELTQVYEKETGANMTQMIELRRRQAQLIFINLPTAFITLAPFGLMPWGAAHILWMTLTGAGLLLCAVLMWRLGAERAPVLSGALAALWLLNGVGVFLVGNAAGIAISLCVIAVWCFVRERFAAVGIVCMALSLTLKPQDAGLVWLYFLLAGGVYRRRALETLGLTAILSVGAMLWVHQVSPDWMRELSANLVSTTTGQNGVNNPASYAVNVGSVGMMICLQTVTSVLWSSTAVYNAIAYGICGVLLLVWGALTVRTRASAERVWIGLAVIAAFTMLPVYHRTHDAKLLLLALPACAYLCAEGNQTGRIAAILTTAAFFFTGDLPLYLLVTYSKPLREASPAWVGKAATIVLARPAPLCLLVLGIFYLWVYAKRTGDDSVEETKPADARKSALASG
jgi:hypothetical protein